MERLPSLPLVMTKPKVKLDRLQATLSKLGLDKSLCGERQKAGYWFLRNAVRPEAEFIPVLSFVFSSFRVFVIVLYFLPEKS